jgi:hypothetical protein
MNAAGVTLFLLKNTNNVVFTRVGCSRILVLLFLIRAGFKI